MISLGLGEFVITDVSDETISTHALGSCIALIFHCPKTKCSAMAHIVLPKKEKHHKAHYGEGYFADRITLKFIEYFLEKKTCKPKDIKIVIIGGADSQRKNDYFNIGERNLEMVKRILDSYQLNYNSSETSGRYSRSVTLDVKEGIVNIRKQNMIL